MRRITAEGKIHATVRETEELEVGDALLKVRLLDDGTAVLILSTGWEILAFEADAEGLTSLLQGASEEEVVQEEIRRHIRIVREDGVRRHKGRIDAIKAVRSRANVGLRRAMELVDGELKGDDT